MSTTAPTLNSPQTERITVYSYRPIPGLATIGGFEFAREGTLEEAGVITQYGLDTDVWHHDWVQTHDRRLLSIDAPAGMTDDAVRSYIHHRHLDDIEAGVHDDTDDCIGHQLHTAAITEGHRP
ncbi:hypothetical protein [Leifsonia aquatica]|uniref:hypothetical protein n=1 Tax=Leifsonia aquatica TaxID=144185 RepID=UPI00046A6EDA|nr:hypothetical protein [Leifsonia aquatica]